MLSYGITREILNKTDTLPNSKNIDMLVGSLCTKGYSIIELQNEMSLLLEVVTKKFTKALQ